MKTSTPWSQTGQAEDRRGLPDRRLQPSTISPPLDPRSVYTCLYDKTQQFENRPKLITLPRQGRQVAPLGEGHRRFLLRHVPKDRRCPHSHVTFLYKCPLLLPLWFYEEKRTLFSSIVLVSYICLALFVSNTDQTRRFGSESLYLIRGLAAKHHFSFISSAACSRGQERTTSPRIRKLPGSLSLPRRSGTHPIIHNHLSFSVTSPWLVLGLLVMLMKRLGKLTAPAAEFNSTLIWLWPNDEEEVLHT